jgi:PAS domain-containing protein
MEDINLLMRRLEREIRARQDAEIILEEKSRALFEANANLAAANEKLSQALDLTTTDVLTERFRIQTLADNLDSGIVMENAQKRIVLLNARMAAITGIDLQVPTSFPENCSESAYKIKNLFENQAAFLDQVESLSLEPNDIREDLLFLKKGNVLRRIHIPVYENNKFLGSLYQYQDVTIEKQRTDALRQSEDKYRGIIENMELGLLEVDNHDIITKPYPRFCDMLGYQASELIGRNARAMLLPEDYHPIL